MKRPTSARVTISRRVGSSPASGSVLTAQSLLWIICPPHLSLPGPRQPFPPPAMVTSCQCGARGVPTHQRTLPCPDMPSDSRWAGGVPGGCGQGAVCFPALPPPSTPRGGKGHRPHFTGGKTEAQRGEAPRLPRPSGSEPHWELGGRPPRGTVHPRSSSGNSSHSSRLASEKQHPR